MIDNLKFLGIQMDCTSDTVRNANHIAKSLYDNPECDYAITPECALSGYGENSPNADCDEALEIVLNASRETQTGLFLGTMAKDGEDLYNDCLIISNQGTIVNHQPKSQIIPYDTQLGCKPAPTTDPIQLPNHPGISAGVMVCNDFWGGPLGGMTCIPQQYCKDGGVNILIHCTNGARGNGELIDQINWDWHTAWLQQISSIFRIVVISVDNSCHMKGEPYNGRTSSPSGCWVAGEKIAGVPEIGQHNFTVTLPMEKMHPWGNALQNHT